MINYRGKIIAFCEECTRFQHQFLGLMRECSCQKTYKVFKDFVMPTLIKENLYVGKDFYKNEENERQVYRLNMIIL